MKDGIKLKLNGTQLLVLNTLVNYGWVKDVEELREQPTMYLVAACMFELRRKIQPIAEDMAVFGKRDVTIRLSRAQALAFDLCFDFEQWDDEAVSVQPPPYPCTRESYEYGLIVHICGMIRQKFY